jgi:NADP-dependent 3-hydroxy acid dehydrogenase YdfG
MSLQYPVRITIKRLNALGKEVYPGGGVYCASKHAVDALTRTLRMELMDTQINVTSIDPGMVETEFSLVRFGGDKEKAANVYKGVEPLTGQDVAEAIVFAASRRPNVQIASMTIFPTAQSGATSVYRKQ